MAKQSTVDTTAVSNEPADRLVAEALPNGVVVDHRTGTVTGPKQKFSFTARAEARRQAAKPVVEKAAPRPPHKGHKGRPAMAPREQFDPRANEICYEVVPTMSPEDMNLREWIRFQVVCNLARPIGIWVLISAIGRGGDKVSAVYHATCQMAAETERNNAIRILFRWALTFEVYPIALLEDGDFERWDNIAYRLEKWATERKHPELANFKTVLKVNEIQPAEPNTPVVQVELPYEQVRRIAYDMGIEPIAVLARVNSRSSKSSVQGKKVVFKSAPEPAVASPVAAPAPKAEVTDELEPDEPTEEVPRAVEQSTAPEQADAPAAPEAPQAEEVVVNVQPEPVVEEPVRKDVTPPAADPPAEPVPTKVETSDELAAKLAGCSLAEFLAKPAPLRQHFRRQVAQQKAAKPVVPTTSAPARKGGRTSMTLADLKDADKTE